MDKPIQIGIFSATTKVSIIIIIMDNGKGMAMTVSIKDNQYLHTKVIMSGKLWVDVRNNRIEVQYKDCSTVVEAKYPQYMSISEHIIGMKDEIFTVIELPFFDYVGSVIALSHSIPDKRACVTLNKNLFWCNTKANEFEVVDIPTDFSKTSFTQYEDRNIFVVVISNISYWINIIS